MKRREEERKKKQDPSDTLFVVNFDPNGTRASDIEDYFQPFARVRRVRKLRFCDNFSEMF